MLNSLMSLTNSGNSDEARDAHCTHSATRNVGLETFNGHNRADGHNADGLPASYSVFASRSHNSPFSGDMENNVVMKTTEVAIRTEMVETDVEGKDNGPESPKFHRHRPKPSPASSEVEFAHDGF